MPAKKDQIIPAPSAELVVVANRLPVMCGPDGAWHQSPGGLVSALSSALGDHQGLWVGWPGTTDSVDVPSTHNDISMRGVHLSPKEYEEYYLGFSNATLWPLYHDAIRSPAYHREWWDTYREVNSRFAIAVAESVAPGGKVWVHDYQLQLVPGLIRRLRPDVHIGFFLHIPFPPSELFMQLPWRKEILTGLAGADVVEFQVHSAAANFSRLVRHQLGASGTDSLLQYAGRTVAVESFPISVDCDKIRSVARDPQTQARAAEIRHNLGNPEKILLGVDRLDYTKGIQQRIRAVTELFTEGTLQAGKHVMVQVAVPSRETDTHYEVERQNLEQSISALNGDYGKVGMPVVHYIHKSLDFEELVALYLAADIMLVTPYRDGMNLVAKEYVMARVDHTGQLILSEFAGAALELRGATRVNPHDIEDVKNAIRAALVASPEKIRSHMTRMQKVIQRYDIYAWVSSCLSAIA
jgi:trehalose 6-phosphate synthase